MGIGYHFYGIVVQLAASMRSVHLYNIRISGEFTLTLVCVWREGNYGMMED